MGRMHYGNWKRIPGVKVVAICDANLAQLNNVSGGNIAGADASTDFTGVAVYDDAMRMIREADVDVVDICVPTPYHADLIVAALAASSNSLYEAAKSGVFLHGLLGELDAPFAGRGLIADDLLARIPTAFDFIRSGGF